MNSRFNDLVASLEEDEIRLNQHIPEWRAFFEYVRGYFAARDITRPIVVEIGILDGAQAPFYEMLLGAEYIGIDSGRERSARGIPDVKGDSQLPETVDKLKKKLDGQPIDLLFIDGSHTYQGAKSDYELYGPMTKHIIAFHDIHTPTVDVRWVWKEILAANKTDTIITIQHYNPREPGAFNGDQLGIGVIVKDGVK